MDQDTTVAGVKAATAVAAAVGSAVSLSYLKGMTRRQLLVSFLSGTVTALAGTPLLMHYLALPTGLEGAVGFFSGLGAMAAIPAAYDFIARLKNAKVPFLPDDKGQP